MKTKIILLTFVLSVFTAVTVYADTTFSEYWKQDASGNWHVEKPDGTEVKDAWLCDDAVPANGKNIWYLLDENGNMISAGLVQDGTGNYYSLETEHNGYYGMLRYQSGTYGNINLTLEENHTGNFAAVLNPDGIDALRAQYGVTSCAQINNGNIIYTSSFGTESGGNFTAAGGTGSGASAATTGRYTVVGGPNRIVPTEGKRKGQYIITTALWGGLLNIAPEEINSGGFWNSPNEKMYYFVSNDHSVNTDQRSKYNYGYAYHYNGEEFVCGLQTPSSGGNEAGEWIVDTTKPDIMYGKTNLRFRYPDGTYAGLGWHSCNMSAAYDAERKILRAGADPEFLTYSGKWSQCFTEDGYMLRNTEIYCEFCWQGIGIKAGYDGSWLDGVQY